MDNAKQPNRVAVFTRKGGAGKTTLTVLLALELIRSGLRVLVVDLDPQSAGSTWALGLDVNRPLIETTLDLVRGRLVAPTQVVDGRLAVIPISQREAALEHVLRDLWRLGASSSGKSRRGILDARLQPYTSYDYILIDCPTALGEVTLNALEAADLVLSPLDLEMPGNVQAAVDLEEQLFKTGKNPPLRFVGNKWNERSEQRRLSWEQAERVCGTNLLTHFRIPDVEAVKKAIFRRVGIHRMGEPARGAMNAFFDLAVAVIEFFKGENRGATGGEK